MAVHFLWMPLTLNSFGSSFLDNVSLWTPKRAIRHSCIFSFYHRVKFIPSAICAAEANEVCRSSEVPQLFVRLRLIKPAGVLMSLTLIILHKLKPGQTAGRRTGPRDGQPRTHGWNSGRCKYRVSSPKNPDRLQDQLL
jgi:hypothetical protein